MDRGQTRTNTERASLAIGVHGPRTDTDQHGTCKSRHPVSMDHGQTRTNTEGSSVAISVLPCQSVVLVAVSFGVNPWSILYIEAFCFSQRGTCARSRTPVTR